MNDIASRNLLIASYCVMCTNMAIEVVAHSSAPDHSGSVTGLLFLLFSLVALVLGRPSRLLTYAATLNILIALVGAYLLLRYVYTARISVSGVPDLIVRAYFATLVPTFAVRYFVLRARSLNSAANEPPDLSGESAK